MDEKEIIIAEVRQGLIEKLEYLEETNDESLQRMINESLKEKSREQYISIKDRQTIARQIFDSMRKLGILEEFIENPDVTEPCTLMKIPAKPRRNRAFQRLSNF